MRLHSCTNRAALLLTLPCWMACQGNDAKRETTAATPPATTPAVAGLTEAEALAQRFGPLLRGAWVNADYLAEVSKTRSPLLAADKVGAVSEIDISLTGQAGDSLAVGLGLGNHEGTNITIYFRPGLQALSLPTNYRDYQMPSNFTEISCQPGPCDTLLLLTTYSKTREIVRRAACRPYR